MDAPTYTEARFTNAGETTLRVLRDGSERFVPVDPENPDYAAIIAADIAIAAHVPTITADDVRAEAARRILAVHPLWKQMNMQARAVELLRIGEANWTTDEAGQADALDAAFDWIKAVRAASNSMEGSPPADYAEDTNWPDDPA